MTAGDSTRRPYAIVAAILAVAVAAAVGLLGGHALSDDDPRVLPADDSVDVGFARDMQVHHAQAVEMSFIVRDNTDDKRVRLLAYDIATAQEQQIGQMYAWLQMWGLPQHSSQPRMAWMSDMDGHDMSAMAEAGADPVMPGMATSEQLDQLRAARGRPAEILFMQLMIPHHEAGIEMAQYATDHAESEEVRLLAENMVIAQEAEIEAMNEMLVTRGAEPVD